MVKLTAVNSGLWTLIFFTVFSVTYEASLRKSVEDYFNTHVKVLDQNPENRLRPVFRHSRSRSHFLRSNRRTASDQIFLNSVFLESHDTSNSHKNKFWVMKSSSIDHDQTVKNRYEISTVADVIEQVDSSTSLLDATVPEQWETKQYLSPTTPRTTHAASRVNATAEYTTLKTTVVPDSVIKHRTIPSIKKFPNTKSSTVNVNDSFQNYEHKLRSIADLTLSKSKDRLDGGKSDGNEFTDSKGKFHSLSYEEESPDFGIEGTDSDISEDVLGTVGETVDSRRGSADVVTRFLTIVESQHLLGENCTAGTDLNLGEGVVDQYAQERFRVEADVAVNRANMLTRLWKYADPEVMSSEYLLHASVFSMVEFDEDIFAAGNCYDQFQYKDYVLFCPYAYRLPEGPILVKDLAVEYKYLSNTSEWFYIARKHAENVITNYSQFSRGESHSLLFLKPTNNNFCVSTTRMHVKYLSVLDTCYVLKTPHLFLSNVQSVNMTQVHE